MATLYRLDHCKRAKPNDGVYPLTSKTYRNNTAEDPHQGQGQTETTQVDNNTIDDIITKLDKIYTKINNNTQNTTQPLLLPPSKLSLVSSKRASIGLLVSSAFLGFTTSLSISNHFQLDDLGIMLLICSLPAVGTLVASIMILWGAEIDRYK